MINNQYDRFSDGWLLFFLRLRHLQHIYSIKKIKAVKCQKTKISSNIVHYAKIITF